MRVLEVKPSSSSNIMPKRKHKIQKDKKSKNVQELGDSDSSDEANSLPQHGGCPHVAKAVNTNAVKKSLKQQGTVGECKGCTDNPGPKIALSKDSSSVDPSPEDFLEELETTIWVCLQCGFQGCDRNSKHQHALKHYQTPRSHSHALVVNLTTWAIWCYECDNDVDAPTKKLEECIEVVRKFAGLPKIDPQALQAKKSGSLKSDSQSLDLNSECASNNIKEDKDKQMQRKSTGHIPTIAKVKGLSNLGNTCFFNAVMQNLTQTSLLERVMVENCRKGYLQHLKSGLTSTEMEEEEEEEENEDGESEVPYPLKYNELDITLGECGILTSSVKSFFGDMNAQTKHSTVSPGALFGQVCRKAPRFKGFQQQDSHELLRHLLDGMKAEEVKRAQQAILKAFHLPDSINPKKVDEEKRARVKEYGRHVKHTFVDQVFGGHFISTVLCEECGELSQIFEPFLDISLPITEEKTPRPNINHSNKRKEDHGAYNTSENASVKSKANVSKKVQRREKKKSKKEQKLKNKFGKDKACDETEEKEEKKDKGGNEENEGKESKDQEEPLSGNEEDNSDADIEDNIESLTDSNRNRFQVLVGGEEDSEQPAVINGEVDEGTAQEKLCHTDSKENSLDNNTNMNNAPQVTPNEVETTENGIIDNKLNNCSEEEENHVDSVTNEVEQLTLEDRLNDNANGNTMCLCKEEESVYDVKSSEKINTVNPRMSGLKSDLKREAKRRAMDTLARKHQPHAQECSIVSCLNQFTAQELLTGSNRFGCDQCTRLRHGKSHGDGVQTVYSNASKQVLIFCPPAILTLHLKRFQQVGFSFRKVNRHVEFPLLLDVAPYCSTLALGVEPAQTQVLYSLYGVVEHSGRLSGGHYTAYVKARPPTDHSKTFLHNYDLANTKLHKVLEEKMMGGLTEHSQDGASVDSVEPIPGKWYHISDSRVDEVTESSVLRCQAYLLFYERIM